MICFPLSCLVKLRTFSYYLDRTVPFLWEMRHFEGVGSDTYEESCVLEGGIVWWQKSDLEFKRHLFLVGLWLQEK